jgi:hypothetical protein
MAQQTSVEWLVEQINGKSLNNVIIDIPKEIIEQAKEMEKQQIIDAVDYTYNNSDYHTTGLLYYNETFNK